MGALAEKRWKFKPTDEEILIASEAFNKLDKDSSGGISLKEAEVSAEALGEMFSKFDKYFGVHA